VDVGEWELLSLIFKVGPPLDAHLPPQAGDDLRQEALAMQLITLCDAIFKRAHLPLRLRPFDVLITSGDAGIIETVPDARSVHIKARSSSAAHA
jgi:phosphatidylinositol kinase/protein kinase (PI-3  family)